MKLIPYDYQQKIIEQERGRDSHALFIGMGLGKTVISLEIMNEKPITKLLVICLVSKREDWKKDALSQSNKNLVILDKGTKKNIPLLQSDCDGFVVNFESLWRLERHLLDIIDDSWGIIIDESHNIKNHTSKVSKYCAQLGRLTPYKAILTGTPQSGGYIDYRTQLNFLGKWELTLNEFHKRYCIMRKIPWLPYTAYEIASYKNTSELNHILQEECVYHERTPDYETTHIDVELPSFKAYATWKKDRVYKGHLGDTMGAYHMGLRTFASGHLGEHAIKSQKLVWLKDLFNAYDKRVVIFYNFNSERDDIVELCESLKLPYSEYNGRDKDLTNFKANTNGVVICNYKSASVGINDLVIASVCVFYSPTNDYILFEQAKKRIDRIGQTTSPTIYYLRVKATVEVAIYNALSKGLDFDERLFANYVDNNN